MSTSLLYHAFGAKNYIYLKTDYKEGAILLHAEKKRTTQYCVECKSKDVIQKGKVIRKIRTLPIGRKQVFLCVHIHRLKCNDCGSLKQEALEVSFPLRRWTRRLGQYIIDLLSFATIKDVAEHLHMSWNTIKDIHRLALERKFKRQCLSHLEYLAVDEVAIRRGHNYLTIVVDLVQGNIVWVGEGRKSESLTPFLDRLVRSGADIQAIAMDMWPAYISAVLQYFPSDVIVYDRYHIMADMNKTLDELRRSEAQDASTREQNIYKGVRYLLLKGSEKIQDNDQAQARLERLLSLNKNLSVAYILKEELRSLWECSTKEEAENRFFVWIFEAYISGIQLLRTLAIRLLGHKSGILNYFRSFATTGKVEGINNKIKVLKRKAYGFRDLEYFKLRLYFLHETRFALVG